MTAFSHGALQGLRYIFDKAAEQIRLHPSAFDRHTNLQFDEAQ